MFCRLFLRKSDEETEFHEFGRTGVNLGQPVKRLVQGQQIVIRHRTRNVHLLQFDTLQVSAAFQAVLAARIFDQDTAHGFCGSAEEVALAVPSGVLLADEAKVRLMHQRSGLQSLPGPFIRQVPRRQSPQFTVNQGQQFLRCPIFALFQPRDNLRDVRNKTSSSFRQRL